MKTRNQARVIIERIEPVLDCGTHPICRVVGEIVQVNADIYADGHDVVQASLLFKHEKDKKWEEKRLQDIMNDGWTGQFIVEKQGKYQFKLQGWVDYALNWQHGIKRKIEDGQQVQSELLDGVQYLTTIESQIKGGDKTYLTNAIKLFQDKKSYEKAIEIAQSEQLKTIFEQNPEKLFLVESEEYKVAVDRVKARFSTWYEFFPRSSAKKEGVHGTFKDCERILPRVAEMGFDILYFPPIHPIGEEHRKGKNNSTEAKKGDVGSPWAIGSKLGGHKDLHPELGSLEDFQKLIKKAKKLGIEIAMDFALQAAPDHPYVKTHPKWFRWRPDGTVQYAENPPKKYQDILPIYFESEDWQALWDELLSIALYWVEQGIQVFRVDNPHTKPFHFWGWLIEQVKLVNPDVIFLSEAFTRPKIMNQLAKQGFTQSYTYFTWRQNKQELQGYLTDLTQSELKEYFRPNFWPNTPDINPWELQSKQESTYLFRHFLAATLSSNYGIYGPVFEYQVGDALPGKEEYLDSEKYEVRYWDWTKENKITHLITKINSIRKAELALQQTNNISFLETENDRLIAYLKWDQDYTSFVICVVNLDPYYRQEGSIHVPRELFGIENHRTLQVKDLITNNSYSWHDYKNYVSLDPQLPYHLFKVSW